MKEEGVRRPAQEKRGGCAIDCVSAVPRDRQTGGKTTRRDCSPTDTGCACRAHQRAERIIRTECRRTYGTRAGPCRRSIADSWRCSSRYRIAIPECSRSRAERVNRAVRIRADRRVPRDQLVVVQHVEDVELEERLQLLHDRDVVVDRHVQRPVALEALGAAVSEIDALTARRIGIGGEQRLLDVAQRLPGRDQAVRLAGFDAHEPRQRERSGASHVGRVDGPHPPPAAFEVLQVTVREIACG